MNLKTRLLNKLRTPGLYPPVERTLVRLAQLKTVGPVFANIAPNNYQYPENSTRVCERGGILYTLDISDYMQYCIYFGIDIEPREILYGLVKNGTTVIDVGTNIGETLLNFARLNRDGLNIGFEPVPHLFEKARANIALNSFDNIELVNRGLSSRKEMLSFRQPGEHNSGGTFLTRDASDAGAVEAVRLDDFVRERSLKDISLIKIDVEGFEMEVLKGAEEVLERFKPVLFVEIDDAFLVRQQSSAAELLDFLISRGYQLKDARTGKAITDPSALNGEHTDVIATAN